MKNRRMAVLLFFSLWFINGQSQSYIEYYKIRNEALLCYTEGDFSNAIIQMKSAFNQAKPFAKDLYFVAYLCAKRKDTTASIFYLDLVMRDLKYFSFKELVEDSIVFNKIMSKENFMMLLQKCMSYYFLNNYLQKRNLHFRYIDKMIDSIIYLDQRTRSLKEEAAIKNSECQRLIDDALAQRLLYELIQKHGWPKGHSELLFTVLLHLSLDNYTLFKPLIYRSIDMGLIEPFWYAYMVDRMELIHYNNMSGYSIWTDVKYFDSKKCIDIGLSPYFNGPYRSFKHFKKKML